MQNEQIEKYFELYTLCWKLLRRGLSEMTDTPDPAKLADDLRTEGQAIYENYRDIGKDTVYALVNTTLHIFYRAYEDLPKPERDSEQMTIFEMAMEG